MPDQKQQDWTRGPAKAAAVAVLGFAGVTGLIWSIATRGGPLPPPPPPGSGIVEGPAPDEPAPVLLIDPNVDGADRLQLLPGIGPELSAGIIQERESGGPFTSAEDLERVTGIGPRTVERIAPLLTFGDEPGLPSD
ncbi:MAG: helix-hairpin-helix domain-containing protein [Planctomycetota bacterium]